MIKVNFSHTPVAGTAQSWNAINQFGQRARFIGAVLSGPRITPQNSNTNACIANVQLHDESNKVRMGQLELDAHADTACVGSDCPIVTFTEKVCNVTPYHPEYNPIQNVPIVQAAAAYTDPDTGRTSILIINEALYMGSNLGTSYLNPNQIRYHGVIVDDIPRHLAPDPSLATHSIYIPSSSGWNCILHTNTLSLNL